MKVLLLCLMTIGISLPLHNQGVPVFPSVEGFERYTTGGRGERVYHVTTLAASDGIPDAWKTARGLNPTDATDGNAVTLSPREDYTNLEIYLNEI